MFPVDETKRAEIRSRLTTQEEKVIPYALPEPLTAADGRKITSPEEWEALRRPEILELFRRHVYGAMPPPPDRIEAELFDEDRNALGGLATRKQFRVRLAMNNGASHSFDLLLYLPNSAPAPVPVFLGLNFSGNQACNDDPAIRITNMPVSNPAKPTFFPEFTADDSCRGIYASRWNIPQILQSGFALATAHHSQFFPDRPDGYAQSIFRLFDPEHTARQPGLDFGAIGAWAWGMSRMLDVLSQESAIDAARAIAVGHSRLGKTALWATANDQRFHAVISNDSGKGGASLWYRNFGENIEWLLFWRTYWFSENLPRFIGKDQELPVDQHELLALIAPRKLYVASATLDDYADPRGEFESLRAAAQVYRLWNPALPFPATMPLPEQPFHTAMLGYHIRTGEHAITPFDWTNYLNFFQRVSQPER